VQNDPFPGYIEWRDPIGTSAPTYTLRNGQPNYTNAQQHTNFAAQDYFTDTIGTALLRGESLDFNTLARAVSRSTNFAEAFAVSKVLGAGYGTAQTAGVVAALIPTVIAGVNTVYQTNIGQATYTSGSTSTSTNNFMRLQALLATQRQRMRTGLFTPGT
jgi:hypothetical protein